MNSPSYRYHNGQLQRENSENEWVPMTLREAIDHCKSHGDLMRWHSQRGETEEREICKRLGTDCLKAIRQMRDDLDAASAQIEKDIACPTE